MIGSARCASISTAPVSTANATNNPPPTHFSHRCLHQNPACISPHPPFLSHLFLQAHPHWIDSTEALPFPTKNSRPTFARSSSHMLSLIHISEPTRQAEISYA